MRPTYGIDLSRAFFENEYIVEAGSVTTFKKAITEAITSAVQTWIPDINIDEVIVNNPGIDGIANLEVLITVPGSISTSLNTTTAIFGNDGTIVRQ